MKRNVQRLLGMGLFIALLMITACATTQLTSTWKDPAYLAQPHKIMVVGLAKKSVNKRVFEDEFVRQLKAKGVDAVASYTLMSDSQQGDHNAITAQMKEHGADSVLIARLASKKTVQTYVPGTVYYPPTNYNNWHDYYGYGNQAIYTPGYTAEDEYALMETNLYDGRNNKLIWSATSETEILGSNQDQIKSYIGVMVDSMAEQKLLK